MTFFEVLADKDINYRGIDYTRMPKIYAKIKQQIKIPRIIHIIGTNGKGSTGRFISLMLKDADFMIGHYTSPHILDFHERIWIDGKLVEDEALLNSHESLSLLLSFEDIKSLSYFEYTTFIAMICFKDCDFIVLEAGLGGEYDATTVFPNILSVVTPIGFDHESYLGDNIKQIATTKLKAVKKEAIVSKQQFDEVYDLLDELDIKYEKVDEISDFDDFDMPYFLKQNLKTASLVVQKLGIKPNVEVLKEYKMAGRCQQIKSNVIIDVGHNELAANVLKNELKGKKFTLVFNMLEDKKIDIVLETLKPIIKNIEIIDIECSRKMPKEKLENAIKRAGFEIGYFKNLDEKENYLVFGSFVVVESFLKRLGIEKSL